MLAVVAAVLGAVASAAVVVVLLSQTGVGSVSGDVSVAECQQRTRQLGTALAAYRAAEGQDAGSWSDLAPYVDQVWPTHSIDFAGSPPQVVVVEGGDCDVPGATDGVAVSGSGDVVAGSALASVAPIGAGVVLGAVALGVVVFFLLGWWLSLAYRCLSPSDQRRAPGGPSVRSRPTSSATWRSPSCSSPSPPPMRTPSPCSSSAAVPSWPTASPW